MTEVMSAKKEKEKMKHRKIVKFKFDIHGNGKRASEI